MHLFVLGEALMDCLLQPDGRLLPACGGSTYNMARAAARSGAQVTYLNPLSQDFFGDQLARQLVADGVHLPLARSAKPTSLAMVQLQDGQARYGFYREGVADRDYTVAQVCALLDAVPPGVLHTGSLALIPPETDKVLAILTHARARGWVISVDMNLRLQIAPDLQAYRAAVSAVMALADWLKASDEDLLGQGWCTPQEVAALEQQLQQGGPCPLPVLAGPQRLAVTFGASGAWLRTGTGAAWLAAPRVTVADTVGAGDTFWGYCVGQWAQAGAVAPAVQVVLQTAVHAAAINCTRVGCEPPTPAEVAAHGTAW